VDIASVGDIAPTLEALLPHIQVRKDGGFLETAVSRARGCMASNGARSADLADFRK
jgi:hypothetical protein